MHEDNLAVVGWSAGGAGKNHVRVNPLASINARELDFREVRIEFLSTWRALCEERIETLNKELDSLGVPATPWKAAEPLPEAKQGYAVVPAFWAQRCHELMAEAEAILAVTGKLNYDELRGPFDWGRIGALLVGLVNLKQEA